MRISVTRADLSPDDSITATFVVELRDHGPAFDPLQAAAPDLEADPDERGIGGLGIHLVRHYIEDLHYARVGDENVLSMTKLLPPA
jgi:anti-sigma regulatory factor (Ser/Thr protein kinase)